MTGFSEYSDKPTLRVNFGPTFAYNKLPATASNENIVHREPKESVVGTKSETHIYPRKKENGITDEEEKAVLVCLYY
jgi:hypothetical protein